MAAMASASSRSRLPRRAWPEWHGGVDVLVFRKASDHVAARRRDGLRSVVAVAQISAGDDRRTRSEEHTSELQSLMRISYAVFCLTTKHLIILLHMYLKL